eukprot:s2010_g17.t1
MAKRMESQVHGFSECPQGVEGEEAVELDAQESQESQEGSDIHSIWKNDVRNFQELIDELGILQKQLSEAHERALSEVREHGRIHPFPRLPETIQDAPSPPDDADLMDLADSEIRKPPLKHGHRRVFSVQSRPSPVSRRSESRLSESQMRSSLSAADRVQLVMRAAQSFEEHVRKETDNDLDQVSRFQIRAIFEYSDIELLDLKKRAITRNASEVYAFGEVKLESGLLRSKSSLEVQEHRLSMTWNERFPLHPSSRPRIFWDFCAMFFLCYDLVIIPMQAFEMPQSAFLEVLSMMCTIYWTLDIGASMGTAVFINGKLVSDSRAICRQYAKTWMTLDVVLVLGDWITVILGTGAADPMSLARTLRTGRVVRMLRLARLLRLMKMKRLVDDVKRRASTELVVFVVNVIQLFLSTALLTHVLACVWYLLGSSESDGWVHTEGLAGNDLGTIYLMSMQWSLSRLHPISLRDNMKLKLPQERMFSLVASFGSLLFSSIFISYVTNTMAKLARLWKERSLKLSAIGEYAANHRVKTTLTVRLKKYVEREEERRRFKENLEVLNQSLSSDLLRILFSAARSHTLLRHVLFAEMKARYSHIYDDLCYEAIAETYLLAGDIVFEPNAVSSRMYLCDAGKLVYCMDLRAIQEGCPIWTETKPRHRGSCCRRGTVLPSQEPHLLTKDSTELSVGAFLSEAALWSSHWQHTGQLSAATDARVLAVKAEEFGLCVQRSKAAMCDVVIYARYFIQDMNHNLINTDLPPDQVKREDTAIFHDVRPVEPSFGPS